MRRLAAACLSFALLLPGGAPADILLTQADGSGLRLASPAARVITLAPNLAELMHAAGAGDRLIATVEYSNFPEAVRSLPRIGDAFRFDLERIMALRPDLVIAWDSGNPAAALARLEALGLPVWRTEIRRPRDIAGTLEAMARAAGLEGPVPAAVAATEKLGRLVDSHAGKSPVSYFYQVSAQPLFTLNGEHLVSQGLALCGGANIFAGEPVLAPQVTREAVLHADPDALIAPVLPDEPDPLAMWRTWPRLAAVARNAFIHLPADEISRATPRMLDSLETACARLDDIRRRDHEETVE